MCPIDSLKTFLLAIFDNMADDSLIALLNIYFVFPLHLDEVIIIHSLQF